MPSNVLFLPLLSCVPNRIPSSRSPHRFVHQPYSHYNSLHSTYIYWAQMPPNVLFLLALSRVPNRPLPLAVSLRFVHCLTATSNSLLQQVMSPVLCA